MQPLQTRLRRLLAEALSPSLRAAGYRKKDPLYHRTLEDLTHVISVQLSQWNDHETLDFTINGGVYVPGVVSRYLRRPDPASPRLHDCCLSVRIGMLQESRQDTWWSMTDSEEGATQDAEMTVSVSRAVEDLLLPFLDRFEGALEVARFLARSPESQEPRVSPPSPAQRHAYAGLIYDRVGMQEESSSELERAVELARGTPIEQPVEALYESWAAARQ